MDCLSLPSSSLGQVSWAGTSLRISFWKEKVMKSLDVMDDVKCITTRHWDLEKKKDTKQANLSAFLTILFLFPGSVFSVSIKFELETCHTCWQKNKKQETVPTSLEVRAFAWRMQRISVTGNKWNLESLHRRAMGLLLEASKILTLH